MINPRKPGLNGPAVVLDKKFGRQVIIGVVDGNRMLSHGFDAEFPEAPGSVVHYRLVKHGKYNVLIGTREPVEVRVIQDGKLLCEQRLDPLPQVQHAMGDSPVVRQVKEITAQPQPFFITNANDGAPLMFGVDPLGRSPEERVKMQLHPSSVLPSARPAGGLVRVGEEPSNIFMAKMDINPVEALGLTPVAPPARPDGGATVEAPAKSDDDTTATAASATTDGADVAASSEPVAAASVEGEVAADVTGAAAAAPAPASLEETPQAPLPELWGESHGLIAIGVRMVQQKVEGEPLMPPDGFDYVLFQLNSWEDHARIRANLHSRIKLPPRIPYKDILDGRDEPAEGHVHSPACGCGRNHGHDPRRFR